MRRSSAPCNASAEASPLLPSLFGDASDFAIEAAVEAGLEPPSAIWGRMCVWAGGVQLGDREDPHCALYPACAALLHLVDGLNELASVQLAQLDDDAAWNLLDGALYGYHGDVELPYDRTADECAADWARWGRFNFLTNWGEQFDGEKAFIHASSNVTLRVLYRDVQGRSVRSVAISRQALQIAVEGFARWFQEQSKKLA